METVPVAPALSYLPRRVVLKDATPAQWLESVQKASHIWILPVNCRLAQFIGTGCVANDSGYLKYEQGKTEKIPLKALAALFILTEIATPNGTYVLFAPLDEKERLTEPFHAIG